MKEYPLCSQREQFEQWLRKTPDVRFWNTTDAMFAAYKAGLAQQTGGKVDASAHEVMLGMAADDAARIGLLESHLSSVIEIARTWRPDYATKMDRDTLDLAAAALPPAGSTIAANPAPKAEAVRRNDPRSALAIRILVDAGHVSQSDADSAFTLACEAMEDEAQRMNIELPWVVRKTKPAKASEPLTVRIVSFPESNGKRNWTAMFVRIEPWDGLISNAGGVSIAYGERWNRVAYAAERARCLLGERATEPNILAYLDDISTPEEWRGTDPESLAAAEAKALEGGA